MKAIILCTLFCFAFINAKPSTGMNLENIVTLGKETLKKQKNSRKTQQKNQKCKIITLLNACVQSSELPSRAWSCNLKVHCQRG